MSVPAGDEPTVVHRYLLYHGPVKPRLLFQMSGAAAVDDALVERYSTGLNLNTLVDYHSPGWLGSFANAIYFTDLVIKCTNLMHWVLGKLHSVVPSWGVCIILLTVLVRGLMFPISRKGALTSLKMQELQPEVKKLQEKYKGDRQKAGLAVWALYSKHGVRPLGTCWFMLLQLPIFMGLYYAFQESIFFRLAAFPPTWVHDLGAPDRLLGWSESIPWISSPDNYGGFFYMGPYLNLLPIVAVTLMLFQQKAMTPPPTTEEQATQQKIMQYMMIFMGLLFYKVAAGLAIYFIASTLWGFAERKFLPRKKPDAAAGLADAAAVAAALDRPPQPAPATAVTPAPPAGVTPSAGGGRGKGRKRKGERGVQPAPTPTPTPQGVQSAPAVEAPPSGPFGWLRAWWRRRKQRLAAWWQRMLDEAEKRKQFEKNDRKK
jgi:YidC/Oxa1 family membrane protein insertase